MKITSLLGTLALSLGLLASPAAAEKFVVGFQPYDTISYQAIVNAELGLWKKYTPAGTEIEFQPALQGTVVANNMLANKALVGYMSVMPATILLLQAEAGGNQDGRRPRRNQGRQVGRLPLQELTGPSSSVPRRGGTATKTVCDGPSPKGRVSAPAPQTGFSQS